ncbi:MAG: universal stress protein [Chloroflexota bacterium]
MFNKILVPLDGSQLAECVFPYLVKIAQDCSVKEVILFSVCESPFITSDYPSNMPETWEGHVKELTKYSQAQCSLYIKDAEKKLDGLGVSNLKIETRLGDAAKEIVDYASQNGIDLIIIASHGRSGPSRWAYGSVADKVFRSTCVPILMVRGPGCESSI